MTCPYCHATDRLGIRVPRLKAAILDHIRTAGAIGATSQEILASEVFRDRRPVGVATIKSHIWQLNDLLYGTDWRIRSDGGRWILARRTAP
jgi:hypothetical protein